MKEVQSKDWQYLVESMIQLVNGDKNHLKPLPKSEKKIIKSMKHKKKGQEGSIPRPTQTSLNNFRFI